MASVMEWILVEGYDLTHAQVSGRTDLHCYYGTLLSGMLHSAEHVLAGKKGDI